MSKIKVSSMRDLTDASGFSFSGGGITAVGTLTVSNITINGIIQGQSAYTIPPQAGNAGKFLASNGTDLEWRTASIASGIRSMQVWTSNGTWTRPTGVRSIIVRVTGAGGGVGRRQRRLRARCAHACGSLRRECRSSATYRGCMCDRCTQPCVARLPRAASWSELLLHSTCTGRDAGRTGV